MITPAIDLYTRAYDDARYSRGTFFDGVVPKNELTMAVSMEDGLRNIRNYESLIDNPFATLEELAQHLDENRTHRASMQIRAILAYMFSTLSPYTQVLSATKERANHQPHFRVRTRRAHFVGLNEHNQVVEIDDMGDNFQLAPFLHRKYGNSYTIYRVDESFSSMHVFDRYAKCRQALESAIALVPRCLEDCRNTLAQLNEKHGDRHEDNDNDNDKKREVEEAIPRTESIYDVQTARTMLEAIIHGYEYILAHPFKIAEKDYNHNRKRASNRATHTYQLVVNMYSDYIYAFDIADL